MIIPEKWEIFSKKTTSNELKKIAVIPENRYNLLEREIQSKEEGNYNDILWELLDKSGFKSTSQADTRAIFTACRNAVLISGVSASFLKSILNNKNNINFLESISFKYPQETFDLLELLKEILIRYIPTNDLQTTKENIEDLIDLLWDIKASLSTVSVGKGEICLSLLTDVSKANEKGDLYCPSLGIIELKGNDGRSGNSAETLNTAFKISNDIHSNRKTLAFSECILKKRKEFEKDLRNLTSSDANLFHNTLVKLKISYPKIVNSVEAYASLDIEDFPKLKTNITVAKCLQQFNKDRVLLTQNIKEYIKKKKHVHIKHAISNFFIDRLPNEIEVETIDSQFLELKNEFEKSCLCDFICITNNVLWNDCEILLDKLKPTVLEAFYKDREKIFTLIKSYIDVCFHEIFVKHTKINKRTKLKGLDFNKSVIYSLGIDLGLKPNQYTGIFMNAINEQLNDSQTKTLFNDVKSVLFNKEEITETNAYKIMEGDFDLLKIMIAALHTTAYYLTSTFSYMLFVQDTKEDNYFAALLLKFPDKNATNIFSTAVDVFVKQGINAALRIDPMFKNGVPMCLTGTYATLTNSLHGSERFLNRQTRKELLTQY